MNNSFVIKYPSTIKDEAVELRKLGYSLEDVANKLNIAKSTSSLWLRNVNLNSSILKLLADKKHEGGLKGLKTVINNRQKVLLQIKNKVINEITSLNLKNIALQKVLCSFLYWGEGGKSESCVSFVNSDPEMIKMFLYLLRSSYNLDESKLRGLVHVHEYHNETEIKLFWSQITRIPLSQFTKSYLKPHTGKIKRIGFKGTIRINYYDSKIAYELKTFYNEIVKRLL
jgi:hypothetical protein